MIDEDSADNDIFIRNSDGEDDMFDDLQDELGVEDYGFDFETSEDDYE